MTDWGGSPTDRVRWLEGRIAEQRTETERWQRRAESAEAELARRGVTVPPPAPELPPLLPDPVIPDVGPPSVRGLVIVLAAAAILVGSVAVEWWLR